MKKKSMNSNSKTFKFENKIKEISSRYFIYFVKEEKCKYNLFKKSLIQIQFLNTRF